MVVVLALAAGILAVGLVLGVVITLVVKRAAAMRDKAVARIGGDPVVVIDVQANFFGLESEGVKQVRGNGCLALTAGELVFAMWMPERDLRIPRASITGIETTKVWLAKTVGRDLLCVRFRADEFVDAAAWYVHDLPAWLAAMGAT